MKRLWAGVCALLLSLTISLILWAMTAPLPEKLSKPLAAAAESARAGNWQEAAACTGQVRREWEKRRKPLLAFMDHAPVENADVLLDQLEVECQRRDSVEYQLLIVRLQNVFDSVSDAHSLCWWNFL